MTRRAGPRSVSDVHAVMVANPALRARNVGNPGVMELLLPLAGGKGVPPVPAEERLPPPPVPEEDLARAIDPVILAAVRRRRLIGVRGLGPEDLVQRTICNMFDDELLAARTDFLLIMVANEMRLPIPPEKAARANPELARRRQWLKRVAETMGGRLLAMGLLVGASDLLGVWPTDGEPRFGLLEVKRPGGDRYVARRGGRDVLAKASPGQMRTEQSAFRRQMLAWGAPHAVVHGRAEAVAAARAWRVPHSTGWDGVA